MKNNPHIQNVLSQSEVRLSFEFFPTKKSEDEKALLCAVQGLQKYKPDFCSVTWGAGGSTVRNSIEISRKIVQDYGLLSLAHITGLGMTRKTVDNLLSELSQAGVRNILALRGDKPHAGDLASQNSEFIHAASLVRYIRSQGRYSEKELGILVAGCPEGHPEAKSWESDMQHLIEKVRLGVQGIVTQLCFDNTRMERFVTHLRSHDIQIPICVGIMIITHAKMIHRMAELSGCSFPEEVRRNVENYQDDNASMEAFGIDYATRQIEGLNRLGLRHFHFYTLNRQNPTERVILNLQDLLLK
jgi:methylenetetrahydrofolate reductase (NADPH)